MEFSLESLKALLLGKIDNGAERKKGNEDFSNSIFDSENFVDDVVTDIFEKCDSNNDGFLKDIELTMVNSTLKSYDEFADIADIETLMQTAETVEASAEVTEEVVANEEQNVEAEEATVETKQFEGEEEQLINADDILNSKLFENFDDSTKDAIKDILDKVNNFLPNSSDEEEIEDVEDVEDTEDVAKAPNNSAVNSVPSGGNYGGGSGSGAVSSGANTGSNDNGTKEVKGKTIEELKAEKADAEKEMSTKQEDLNQIIDETNPELAKLEEEIQTSQEEYLEMLEKESPKLAKELEAQLKTKDETQDSINKTEVSINEKNQEITDLESNVKSLTGKISSYDGSIAKLEGADTSEMSEDRKSEISSRIAELKAEKAAAEKEKAAAEQKLTDAKTKLDELNEELDGYNEKLTSTDEAIKEIQEKVEKLDNKELTAAQDKYNKAEETFETTKANMKTEAEAAVKEQETKINKIQEEIDTKEQEEITKKGSVNSLDDPEGLYESMGLEALGMDKEAFLMAIEGYNNLTDEQKATGYLGIFDTTQGADAERYYLLDLNKFEVVGQSAVKTGTGNMDNIKTANVEGSHATLSGFEQVGEEYYSNSMGKQARRLIGLEEGINDNALSKGCVIHYASGNNTYGCKGFTPVKNSDGSVNIDKTNDKMRELFPTGAIIYTHPTDNRYEEYSELV